MKKNQKAESFVGIMVGIFILGIVILGIVNLLTFSRDNISEYSESNTMFILKQNTTNIVKNLDTNALEENEIFYIHRNSADPAKYEIYTGSLNEQYRYIDKLGNWVENIEGFDDEIFSRILWVSREDTSLGEKHQIIKVSIKKLRKK